MAVARVGAKGRERREGFFLLLLFGGGGGDEEPPHNYNLHIKIWHMDRWHGAEPRAVEAAERPMAPKSRLRVRRQQGQLGWPQKMTRNCLTSGGWL